jgi:hypothetical protein
MEYLKIDPRLDEHPDVLDAGFIGATVFQVILRTCASFDKRGRLPKKFSPAWLARRLNIGDDETSLPPETFVRIGIERCVSAGLLERDGEDLIIPGWERFYTENVPGAERTRSWRQRQRDGGDARDARPSHGDEQRHGDATPPTHPLTPPTPLTSSAPDARPEELSALWNETKGPQSPRVTDLSGARRKAAKAALKRRPIQEWRTVFEKIAASDMCQGRTGMSWVADFDWAIRAGGTKPEPALRALEGSLDARGAPPGAKRDPARGYADAASQDWSGDGGYGELNGKGPGHV